MEKVNKDTVRPCDSDAEFSFKIYTLSKYKWVIAVTVFSATLVSLCVSILLPRVYLSEGFFQIGYPQLLSKNEPDPKELDSYLKKINSAVYKPHIGFPVPNFKTLSTVLFNPNRLIAYTHAEEGLSREIIETVTERFKTGEEIAKSIKPIYAYAKEDTRDFVQTPSGESNLVLGIKLSFEGQSPQIASQVVQLLGNYVRDCTMQIFLYNYISDEFNAHFTDVRNFENDLIKAQFEVNQNIIKLEDVKGVVKNYPESKKIDNRQVVSVQDGGDRFLSPMSQLVGLESRIADLRRKIAGLERSKERSQSFSHYYRNCKNEIQVSKPLGTDILFTLRSLHKEIKNSRAPNDPSSEVYNRVDIDLQLFQIVFNEYCRFVSGPIIPDGHIKPRKSVIISLTFLLSIIVTVGSVFLYDGIVSAQQKSSGYSVHDQAH
jgi:hypothetical protein